MNRRHLAVIAVVIAVGLFAAPLISPVPDYDAHLEVSVIDDPVNFSADNLDEIERRDVTKMRYQTLTAPAQRLFERAYKAEGYFNGPTVPRDEAPESWVTLVPKGDHAMASVYVRKDGHYYRTRLSFVTPAPSLQAFMLRLGPLLGAIGLGTLAGYFVLTAEN
jgi:hypothetical protein